MTDMTFGQFGAPSRCSCMLRPRCEYNHCERRADWSILTRPFRWAKTSRHGRLHFMCNACKDDYLKTLSAPLKGIDRPENAGEDWKPSLEEHLRFSAIAIAFNKRKQQRAPEDETWLAVYWNDYETKRGYTPGQRAQAAHQRALIRKYRIEHQSTLGK